MSSFHEARPALVSSYSAATVASSTPQRDRIRAQRTPVRSLPAVQWMSSGVVGLRARCSRISRYEAGALLRMSA